MARGKGHDSTTRIILFDGFEILKDTMNYTVVYNTGKTDKDGSIVYKYLSYHSTLDRALKACKSEYAKREISKNKIMSLEDAVSAIVRSNNRFESLIKNAFEGVEA